MNTTYRTHARGFATLVLLVAVALMTLAPAALGSTGQPGPPSERLVAAQTTAGDATAGGGAGEAEIRPVVQGPHEAGTAAPGRYEAEGGFPAGSADSAARSVSSDTSTSILLAVAALAGGLGIVLWAYARTRIRRREPSFDCEATLLGC